MSISDFENQTPEGSGTKWTNNEPSQPTETATNNPAPQAPSSEAGPFDNVASEGQNASAPTTSPTEQVSSNSPVATVPSPDNILNNVLGRIGNPGDKPHFKLMVIGPPGQGKSSLALAASNNLIYDFEDGLTRALANPHGKGNGTQGIPYVNMDEFRHLVAAFMSGDNRLSQFEVFTIDTLSDLHKRDLAEITERDWRLQPSRNRYVPETEQYTEVNERIVRVVRALRDLPLNIIITSHSKTVEPKNSPSATYADFSESLSNKVMAMMDMVGYLQMQNVENQMVPVLRFKTDGVIRCKAPSFIPDELINPTYDDIRLMWEEGIKSKANN